MWGMLSDRGRKSIWQNSTLTHAKDSLKTSNRRELPQPETGHLGRPTADSTLSSKRQVFPQDGNKAGASTLTGSHSTQYRSCSQCRKARKRNQSHPDWKGRSKIVPICRQQKPLRTEKWALQGCRMQGQEPKIAVFSHANNEQLETEIKH